MFVFLFAKSGPPERREPIPLARSPEPVYDSGSLSLRISVFDTALPQHEVNASLSCTAYAAPAAHT